MKKRFGIVNDDNAVIEVGTGNNISALFRDVMIKAAKDGDPLGRAVIELEAERIALYVAAISAIVDVELVVLSGGIGRQADFFIAPIRKLVNEILPFPPKIEVSKLGESGILVGALQIATAQACDLVFQTQTGGSVKPIAGSM